VLKLPLSMEALNFQEEIQQEPIDLPRAALRYAMEICYPTLDVANYLAQLDVLAGCARQAISNKESKLVQAGDAAHYLFHEAGFRGNASAYNDPRNSYLNEVLERRLGIPITLAVLYMAEPEVGLGSLNALPVAIVVLGLGLSLGGPTGYAINPARDLGPRLMHFFLPISNKRNSDWGYSWVPILGPLVGAAIAAGMYLLFSEYKMSFLNF